MFVDTLVDNVFDYFQELHIGCIRNWDTMKQRFEECYKWYRGCRSIVVTIGTN